MLPASVDVENSDRALDLEWLPKKNIGLSNRAPGFEQPNFGPTRPGMVLGRESLSVKKQRKPGPDKRTTSLQVEGSASSEPLRVCVRNALDNYFVHLDGHDTSGLHRLVVGEVEGPLFEAVLEHTNGNQSKAAEMLGINRSTLRKKLREYNLA